jgi:ABC-type transporter Mla subunit MlaD
MTEHERGTEREQHDRLQAEYRYEMGEEGELKREWWAAREDINRLEAEVKRLTQQVAEQKGSMARTREVIRKACHRLADPYDHLHDGLWVDGGLSLQDLVENIVDDLRTERGNVQRLQAELNDLRRGLATIEKSVKRALRAPTDAETVRRVQRLEDDIDRSRWQRAGE